MLSLPGVQLLEPGEGGHGGQHVVVHQAVPLLTTHRVNN